MAGVILLSLPENPSKKTTPQFDYILLNSMTRADGMSFLCLCVFAKATPRHAQLCTPTQSSFRLFTESEYEHNNTNHNRDIGLWAVSIVASSIRRRVRQDKQCETTRQSGEVVMLILMRQRPIITYKRMFRSDRVACELDSTIHQISSLFIGCVVPSFVQF
jgi:hypothetical protein